MVLKLTIFPLSPQLAGFYAYCMAKASVDMVRIVKKFLFEIFCF